MAVVRSAPISRVLRILGALVLVAISAAFARKAVATYRAPTSAIHRYRAVAQAPRVFARGTLRGAGDKGIPPLCSVSHERLERCGKSSCWIYVEGMSTSQGELEVTWSSAPLPPRILLSSSWKSEPEWLRSAVVEPSDPRFAVWKTKAQRAQLGFSDENLAKRSTHRIVERCVEEGEEVFVAGCVEVLGGKAQLVACAGAPDWGLVRGGDPQPAIDAAANDLAWPVTATFACLLVAALLLTPKRGMLVDALAARVAPLEGGLGISWLFVAIIPAALFGNVLFHASQPPSTWATGRGGYVFAICTLAAWAIVILSLFRRRRAVLAALSPVLGTPRSLLAQASGTVELAVRARRRPDTPPALLGDRPVAFSEAVIKETYKLGKNESTLDRGVWRGLDVLEIVDESGDGVLQLGSALLDVEVNRATYRDAPPRLEARGVTLERHPAHINYKVEERVIYEGDPLYVMGEVSQLELHSGGEGGYRSVRGSPTLGGADMPPVLVFAGDERGLVELLEREARGEHRLAVFAACAAGLLSAAVTFLAYL
jgi:hypothetical protein